MNSTKVPNESSIRYIHRKEGKRVLDRTWQLQELHQRTASFQVLGSKQQEDEENTTEEMDFPIKGYLLNKMITPENVLSEAQVKNFLIS